MEFMSLMMFSELLFSEAECNSGLNDIHQSDGFTLILLEDLNLQRVCSYWLVDSVILSNVHPSIRVDAQKKIRRIIVSSCLMVLGTSPATSIPKVVNEEGMNEVGTTVLVSFPPFPTQVTTSAGNAPGKSSYANVTSKPSGKKLNIHTLFTPGGNGIDVVVLVESIRAINDNKTRTRWGPDIRTRFDRGIPELTGDGDGDGESPILKTGIGAGMNGSWFIRNNPLILKKWHPDENLLKKDVSTVPVWVKLHGVPVTAFSDDGLSAIATKLGTPLMLDSYTSDMCMQSWGRSSYARVMIELRADMELKDNIVVAMPRIKGEGHYICNVCVGYEWKPSRCTSCKVFGYIHEECPKNTGTGEKKTLKKPSQTSRGVLVGLKMGFKPHKEYRPVPNKPNASSSGNKKKGVKPTIEVSNSNPFDVLNSVDNDADLGTNGGSTNLVNNEATSSGSSFMNVDNNTPIIDKIGKFEDLISSGQAILVDNAGNPLKKVEFLGDYDSEDEVASVDNDMAHSLTSKRVGFGTQSLLEQWRDSYGNGDYDEDPYDEDMYEGQDVTGEIQAMCDNLDIRAIDFLNPDLGHTTTKVDAAIKHMASNFAKFDKFEGVDFRRWQKKMHFLLSSMSVVYVLTTPMPEDGGDNLTVEQNVESSKELWDSLEAKYMAEGASNFKHTLKHKKEELTLVELGSHLRIEESFRVQDSDKPKSNNVVGPSVVNMVKHNNSSRDCKGVNVGSKANSLGIKGSVYGSSNSLKGQNMFKKSLQVYYVTYVFKAYFVQDDDVAWWVDSGATVHVCKDRCWFKTYESLNDGSILHMGNESTALVHGRGCVDLRFSSG
ncbi:retrotransposon protein, putative, ty1-copia subclass [Tanacetum coccineum]